MIKRRGGDYDLEAEIPRLRRLARMLAGGDRAEADDLVQETLLRALRSIDGFRGGSSLSTWLASILVNLHRSGRRRDARRRTLMDGQRPPEEAEPARQEQRVELEETLEALAALPEDQREAIALVALEGVGYAEAAEVLGVKLGTLMSRIARGRKAMRAAMDGPRDQEGEIRWIGKAR
jgi:RNA polymerase sigma-70 factor (ECF subfamily)